MCHVIWSRPLVATRCKFRIVLQISTRRYSAAQNIKTGWHDRISTTKWQDVVSRPVQKVMLQLVIRTSHILFPESRSPTKPGAGSTNHSFSRGDPLSDPVRHLVWQTIQVNIKTFAGLISHHTAPRLTSVVIHVKWPGYYGADELIWLRHGMHDHPASSVQSHTPTCLN